MSPVPKRRWFQFSLRTLFVVVTAVAIVLPAVVRTLRRWEAERTVEELRKQLEITSHVYEPDPD